MSTLIPSLLYRMTGRDQGQPWCRMLVFGMTQLTAAVQVASTYTTPKDRATIITNLSALAIPGVAQSLLEIKFDVFLPGDPQAKNIKLERFAAAAAVRGSSNWQGQIMIPPNCVIRTVGTFDVGAVGNSVSIDLFGVTVPLGTLQLP